MPKTPEATSSEISMEQTPSVNDSKQRQLNENNAEYQESLRKLDAKYVPLFEELERQKEGLQKEHDQEFSEIVETRHKKDDQVNGKTE